MKITTFSCLFFAFALFPSILFGQFLQYDFARTFQSADETCSLRKISIDAENNIYVVGTFEDTLTYQNTMLISPNLTSSSDYFFAKLNNAGELIWIKQGSENSSLPVLFEVDDDGNIFMGHRFYNNSTNFHTLVKMDTNGQILWENLLPNQSPNTNFLAPYESAKSGFSYGFGFHQNPTELDDVEYNVNDDYNGLLVKYAPDGSIENVIQMWSDQEFRCLDIESNDIGEVYLVIFQNSDIFIDGELHNKTSPDREVILLKFNAGGNLVWKKSLFNSTHNSGQEISFEDRLTFNAHNKNLIINTFLSDENPTFLGNNYSSNFNHPFYSLIVSLNENGETAWVKQLESEDESGTIGVVDIAINDKGDIYFSGQFFHQIPHGEYLEKFGTLAGEQQAGSFIIKYSAEGVELCIESVEDDIYNFLQEIAIDENDDLWLAGLLAGKLTTQEGEIDAMGQYGNGVIMIDGLLLKTSEINFPHCEYSIDLDTFLCKNQPFELDAILEDKTYVWSNGDDEKIAILNGPGTYQIAAYDESCVYRDTIMIEEKICSCDLEFPNAFTPNGDGTNDVFTHIGDCEITDYHLRIYNRFGQKVFESRDQNMGWDGKDASADVYIWRLDISAKEIDFVFEESFQGDVTLIK